MKLVVLGAKGMVGSWLVQRAQQQHISVVGFTHQEIDICSLAQLRAALVHIAPTHIINCAAYTDVDGAEKQEALAFAVNAQGAENGAQVAKELNARYIHISTDYVFSGQGSIPYIETDHCSPVNVYGRSKLEGEKRVLSLYPKSCIVRTSWVFGPKSKNLISSLLSRFSTDLQLRVVTDQVGKPTYYGDLVDAIFHLLEMQGVIHFANEGAASRYEVANTLLTLSRQLHLPVVCNTILPARSSDFPTVAQRPLYSVLDTSKYTALTSMTPRPWTEAALEFLSL